MKYLAVIFCLAVAFQVTGALISEETALESAQLWMAGNPVMGPAGRSVESVESFPETGYQVFVVRLAPKGYLILNTDEKLPLMVSFSADSNVDLADLPENAFRAMLLSHVERMQDLLRQPAILANAFQPVDPLAVTELYGPFMTTTWNQCNPYNKLCPVNPTGTEYYAYRAASGCVPTAYSQVMNFHRWPVHGMGSNTYTDDSGSIQGTHSADFSDAYDWSSMQTSYDAYGSAPVAQEDAVAELMYELGVAVEADYETNGTSAVTFLLGNRLSTFFYYETCSPHSTLATLTLPLEADLRAGFPCIVSIPGHAIVADGLMVDSGVTTYHINYGWGGTNNGWWQADNVAGNPLGSGVTSIRPKLMAFPVKSSVTGAVDQVCELEWTLPKQRESEADKLTIYNLASQPGLWSSDASALPDDNEGWSISGAGRTGSCWYAGPYGPDYMVLDKVLMPDASTSLSFWMYYRLGTATFTLQISTNGGSSFQQVFSASDHYGNSWENKNVSLAAFADQQVILRLELSIGTYYSGGGVWIDDLSVNSGSWLNWDPFYTDTTLAAHRFSSTVTELDNCDDFSVFQKTSTSTYKDWVCSTTGGVANCFYKEPGGYSNHKYHLTSISTITPTASTRLLLRAKYSLYTDGFQVLVSTDHVNFTQLWSGAGTLDWGDIAIDLGAYADQPIYVRFEYIPAGYYTTGGIWIDTVSLENVTNPEYEGQPIHYTQIPSPAAGMHTLKAVLTDSSLVEHAMGPAFTLSVYDNDGMPVDWEQLYGFDPFVDDSALDLDLDGFSNLDEYIAGTLPDNSNSVFRIGIEGQTIKWPARDDRTYRVLKADEPAGPYSVLQSVEGPVSNYTDNATLLRRFYKVDVGL